MFFELFLSRYKRVLFNDFIRYFIVMYSQRELMTIIDTVLFFGRLFIFIFD